MDVSLDSCGRRGIRCLLLLHLFVMNSAADCPKPSEGENVVLTNEALLMNHFPDGSSVSLMCLNGFVRESGSGIIRCIDGNWTEPDLTCKRKDCGMPKPQPNMSFNTSAGTLYGAVIKVVCDKGFQISGSSYRQCYAFGWSGGKAKCEIVTCPKPAQVTNGRSSWDSQDNPQYGEIIQYICNEGYTLIGKNSMVCNETGEYDSQPPTCKGVTTEDSFTTEMVTPTPPEQEVSTSTDSPATPTTHRDTTVTTSATPSVSPSVRGGRGFLTAEGKATTASVTSVTSSSSFQGKHDGAVDTNKGIGYIPVIVSVICVSLVACIFAVVLHKFLLGRKGSYDTREDLKPELLQFQNL